MKSVKPSDPSTSSSMVVQVTDHSRGQRQKFYRRTYDTGSYRLPFFSFSPTYDTEVYRLLFYSPLSEGVRANIHGMMYREH